jgi:23S rRNA pseudouridine2605 synthase
VKTKPSELRIQRILSQAGLTSRRTAEEWIRSGRVTIDGEVITEPGRKASPQIHRIAVDGNPIPRTKSFVYFLFHKPRKVVSTLHDPQGRPCLKDFLAKGGIRERVFPVGRLDWDAEGLILMTNDGDLAQGLQHPRYQVPKTYRVKVSGIPSLEAIERLKSGIKLSEGDVHRADVERLKRGEDRAWFLTTVREGEKHQIKKMWEAVGHPVLTLKRVSLGPLTLGRLAPGQFRPLTQLEINKLRKLFSASQPGK